MLGPEPVSSSSLTSTAVTSRSAHADLITYQPVARLSDGVSSSSSDLKSSRKAARPTNSRSTAESFLRRVSRI
jgi:hypothetical protein